MTLCCRRDSDKAGGSRLDGGNKLLARKLTRIHSSFCVFANFQGEGVASW